MDSKRLDLIAELFEAALELEPDDRRAYLEAASRGDAALLAEVVSLLEHHAADKDSFDGERADLQRLVADVLEGGAPTPEAVLPGFEIPGFRILGLLGEGGMGRVYEARQEKPLRLVALKILKPSANSSEMRKRFEREEAALARLQHPGIAQIFEAGVIETELGPLPWYAMERVHGLPLIAYARQHELDLTARLELVASVADDTRVRILPKLRRARSR